MQITRRRDTAGEVELRSALHHAGLRFTVDASPLGGMRRRADIVFRRARVAVYVDGCFWHACPRHASWPKANSRWWRDKIEANVRRDRDTDRQLRRAGWRVVRVWAHVPVSSAVGRVVRLLRPVAGGA